MAPEQGVGVSVSSDEEEGNHDLKGARDWIEGGGNGVEPQVGQQEEG